MQRRKRAGRRGLARVSNALANALVGSSLMPRRMRRAVLAAYGLEVDGVTINARCYFGGRDIDIGRGSFVNVGCVFDNTARIEIGADCRVGMGVMLVTSEHALGPHERRGGEVTGSALRIGDGCWIGARAVLLPGATVGDGCVIAAGALVRGDCEPDTLYAGVPARAVRRLDEEEPRTARFQR
jgi:maltose O-acetyltransferase